MTARAEDALRGVKGCTVTYKCGIVNEAQKDALGVGQLGTKIKVDTIYGTALKINYVQKAFMSYVVKI